jgi:hypothetical protein
LEQTITAATVLLQAPGNAIIPATVTYNAATLTATLTPSAPLSYFTTYVATVKHGVRDASWNELASDVTWSFTTESDTTPPTVTGKTPAAGATNVALTTAVTATFNEAMTGPPSRRRRCCCATWSTRRRCERLRPGDADGDADAVGEPGGSKTYTASVKVGLAKGDDAAGTLAADAV